MTRLILICTPSTLSKQLAEIQKQGLVPSGPTITWDSRKDSHPDYLEVGNGK